MATPKSRRPRRQLGGLTSTALRTSASAAEQLDNLKLQVVKYGLLAGAGAFAVGGLLLVKKEIRDSIDQRRKDKVTSSIAVTNSPADLADQLRNAFNPSGIEWMQSFDTTDVTGVMNVARRIASQAQYLLVVDAYRKLTKRDLAEDLNAELSAQERQQFRQILAKKPKK